MNVGPFRPRQYLFLKQKTNSFAQGKKRFFRALQNGVATTLSCDQNQIQKKIRDLLLF